MPPEPVIAAPLPLLEARALTKRFDALLALDAVSLAVAPGTAPGYASLVQEKDRAFTRKIADLAQHCNSK